MTMLLVDNYDSYTYNVFHLMAAVAVCIIAVTFPLVLLQRWLLKTAGKYVSVKGKATRQKLLPLGGWKWIALAVGADGVMGVRRSALAKALVPMEALAFKVEREMENSALTERLLRAEKLAGLGLMAGGMVQALNNPLTAVLGFGELIAATTGEGRVKEDAGIIVREALRMRETVETKISRIWRRIAG